MELENLKLIQLLKSFSISEIKELNSFVNSPFFNSSEQIIKVFNLLYKDYPLFNSITKEKIFSSVYPGESYKDKKVRDLLSRLLKLTEEFLSIVEFNDRDILKARFTMQQYSKRNLEKHFTGIVKETELKLSNEKHFNSDYFFNRYSVLNEKNLYYETLVAIGKRVPLLETMSDEANTFVVYSMLKILSYGILFQVTERIYNYKINLEILDYVLKYLGSINLDRYPILKIYYYAVILNREEGDEKMYFKMKDLLMKNIDSISTEDLRLIMTVLVNYTQYEAIKGNKEFRKENYAIIKQNTELGFHPRENGFFPEGSFITVVGKALQEKDYTWAEDFMNKFKESLNPDQKENAYLYCRSILDYRLGNYGDALRGLAKVSIDDFYYHLRVKNHLLKIYYETGDYDSAERIIDSFRHFLSTTKHIPEYIRIRFVNYVNFTSRIVNARLSGHLNNVIDVKNEINSLNQETLENKVWLLEQISKINV